MQIIHSALMSHEQRIPTTLIAQVAERPFYALKMHANQLNADKIKQQSDASGFCEIKIYNKTQEKLQIQRMKPHDICIVVQTQPKHYAGAIALVEIIEIRNFAIKVRFVRYMQRKISIEELKNMDPLFQNIQMVLTIPESVFLKILAQEDVKTLLAE